MNEVTTIQLNRVAVKELKKLKKYPRQTYNDLVLYLVKNAKKPRNQYDEFIHKIQQAKMKELWGNEEDEAWENA